MPRLIRAEQETIIRYDGTGEPAVVGSNIPGDVAKLTKLWGTSHDTWGEWHQWRIPKSQVKVPKPKSVKRSEAARKRKVVAP